MKKKKKKKFLINIPSGWGLSGKDVCSILKSSLPYKTTDRLSRLSYIFRVELKSWIKRKKF